MVMFGLIVLCAYLLCGVVCMDAVLKDKSGLIRLWTGSAFGLMLMMWLPFLFAYAMTFNQTAQYCGLAVAIVLAAVLQLTVGKRKKRAKGFMGDVPVWFFPALVLPLLLLSGYLQYTHYLRAAADGALHVGQSTFGDLNLHVGIATGFRNAVMPPEYTILPGTPLGYPFLSDSMATTMLLFGSSIQLAFVSTGTLMMALVYTGFVVLAWKMTHRKACVVLAFVFMFINGGLGFLYTFDRIGADSSAITQLFHGFYKTPTNQPDLNLRWVNVICDMMIPQRTLLAGWTVLIPALYLLGDAAQTENTRNFALLGVWGGMMPMIHTHSFFALGMISAGLMIQRTAVSEKRAAALKKFMIYGVLAMVFAGPQLLKWTFPQTVGGGSLNIRFNWSNNDGSGHLIDSYFWFWIKNVGLLYIVMVPAALTMKKGSVNRGFAFGALIIYAVAEVIQFQPNPYDNNKLFYVAYMIMMPITAVYLMKIWNQLKGIKGRTLLAVLFIGACTISGALSIGREVVSDYELYSKYEVAAANYIDANLPEDAVILTADQHKNAVSTLAGRKIVCGTGSFLYFHGVDYGRQREDERLMLEQPEAFADLFDEYDISYVYISNSERTTFDVNEQWFNDHCELLFATGDVFIYQYPRAEHEV